VFTALAFVVVAIHSPCEPGPYRVMQEPDDEPDRTAVVAILKKAMVVGSTSCRLDLLPDAVIFSMASELFRCMRIPECDRAPIVFFSPAIQTQLKKVCTRIWQA
jgi:hypothetical protein